MAAEIFSLMGSIGLKGAEKVKAQLTEVDKAGRKTSDGMDGSNKKTGESSSSLSTKIGNAYTQMSGHVSRFATGATANLSKYGQKMTSTGQTMQSFGASGKAMLGAVGLSAAGMGAAVAGGMKRLDSLDKANLTFKAFNAAGDKSFGDVTKAAEQMTKGTTMSVSEFGKKVDEYVGKGVPKAAAIATTSLNAFVSGTSVGMTEAANATARFNSVGMDLSKSTDTFKDMTKVLAGTGNATKESIDSASLAISQMAGKGKLDMGNMLQLMNTMPEALNMVSKSTGISSEEIQDAISSGKVTYEDFAKAMQERATEVDKLFEKQGGVMTQTGITFEGAIGRVRASISKFGADILENIGKEDITKAIGDISVKMNEMSKVVAPLIADVVRFGIKAFEMVKPFIPMIASFAAASAGMGLLGGAMVKVGGAMSAFAKHPILGMLMILTTLLINAYTTNETFRNVVNSVVDVLGGFLGAIAGVVGKVTEFVQGNELARGAVGVLKGGLIAVVGALSGFMMIGKITSMLSGFKGAMMASKAVTLAMSGATKAATLAQKGFNLAMRMSPIGMIVTAITAVVAILAWFFTQTETGKNAWQGFMDFMSGLWDGIVNVFKSAIDMIIQHWDTIKQVFSAALDAIVGFIQPFWDGMVQVFNTSLGVIKGVIENVWNIISAVTTTVFNVIKTVIQVVWLAISTYVTTYINIVKTIVTTAWNLISSVTSTVFNAIKTVVSVVWGFISSAITNYVNNVKNNVTMVWNAIVQVTTAVFNGVKAFITAVWGYISTFISNTVNKIKAVITMVWNGIKQVTAAVFNAVKSFVTSVWNGIKAVVTNVVNGVKSAVSNAWNGVKSVTSNIFNGVKNTVTSIWNGIWDTIRGIVDKVKGAFNFKLKFPEIKIPKIPMPHFKMSGEFNPLKGKIPNVGIDWYAKGGIMTRPTAFGMNGNNLMVGGEAGREAVLPLNRNTLGQIGQGIVASTDAEDTSDAKQERHVNVTQYIYSHDSLTPREMQRQARTQLEQLGRFA